MGNVITSIFDTINNSVLYPIYYGLLGTIGIFTLIILIINLVRGINDPTEEKRSMWIKRCIVIIIIALIAGFAPTIINWVIGLSGSNIATVG